MSEGGTSYGFLFLCQNYPSILSDRSDVALFTTTKHLEQHRLQGEPCEAREATTSPATGEKKRGGGPGCSPSKATRDSWTK